MTSPTPTLTQDDLAIAQGMQALRTFVDDELQKALDKKDVERTAIVTAAAVGFNLLRDQCATLVHLLAHANPDHIQAAYEAMRACDEKTANTPHQVH